MSVSLKERPKVKRKPITDKEREDILAAQRAEHASIYA